MFQDTVDMPGMGNELDRWKKKTGGAGNYQSGITKNYNSRMTEHSIPLFCI